MVFGKSPTPTTSVRTVPTYPAETVKALQQRALKAGFDIDPNPSGSAEGLLLVLQEHTQGSESLSHSQVTSVGQSETEEQSVEEITSVSGIEAQDLPIEEEEE